MEEARGPTRPLELKGSEWTTGENLVRALWILVGRPLFRVSFHNWYGYRAFILRLFGATIGRRTVIRPTVRIEIPWLVSIGDGTLVGDYAILYSLGPITIGRRCVISQYAHLCAGSHDHSRRDFRLLRPPIVVEDEAWIAADAFVGPGVTVGYRAVLGARSNAFRDLPRETICVGSPAKPIGTRVIGD